MKVTSNRNHAKFFAQLFTFMLFLASVLKFFTTLSEKKENFLIVDQSGHVNQHILQQHLDWDQTK